MINFINFGKFKNKNYKTNYLEYINNISRYFKVNIVEFKIEADEPWFFEKIKDKILKKLEASYNLVFSEHGKNINSVEFSQLINNNLYQNINIIVGSSWGLPDFINNISNFKLAVTSITMPHELVRIIAAEQVYRAFTIINGEKYNK